MGTYDTVGGGAAAPDLNAPAPSELVEKILGVLEDAGVPTAINDRVCDLVEAAQQEHAALRYTLDLQWKADQIAILKWQAETGKDLMWPDRQELTSWLLGKLGNLLFSVHVIRRKGPRDRVHPTVTFLVLAADAAEAFAKIEQQESENRPALIGPPQLLDQTAPIAWVFGTKRLAEVNDAR